MGYKTKEDNIRKIIADIPEPLHRKFKNKVKNRNLTIRRVIENLIYQYNQGKITLDKTYEDMVE
ncbi:MAG: hypothetical protein RBR32_07845 [Bacteroidales bacterium]|nr:hypothetical protein [Bacteroidales bacterium]